MPDDRRRRRTSRANSVVASAEVLNTTKIDRLPDNANWQDEAWGFYDSVPEVRFACSWLANAMSRCTIYAGTKVTDQDDPEPLTSGAAVDALDEFGGGTSGRAALLADATVHLTVPGVGYLVGTPASPGAEGDDADSWQVFSRDEIDIERTPEGNRYRVKIGEGRDSYKVMPADTIASRFWRRHKRFGWRPDSPVRATLPVLRELEALTQHVDASLVSRLAGNGVLFVPNSIEFPRVEGMPEDADPFIYALTQAMITPIGDRDAASAVVPLVAKVPPEAIEAIKHLTFSTPLDDKAQALRDEALRRFAAGMDMPAEVIQGLAEANHWTAWQIEESAIKLHVEPMLEAICHAITVGYLHPYMKAAGVPVDPDVLVWFDTSELRVRPNRSADAFELFDRQVIGPEALRRETGFDETDAPDEEALQRALLIDIAKSAPTLAPLLLPAAGIELPGVAREAIGVEDGDGEPTDGDDGGDAPADGPPERDTTPPDPATAAAAAALIAAADGIVHRALERAGGRIEAAARRAGLDWQAEGDRSWWHVDRPVDLRLDLDAWLAGSFDRCAEVAAVHHVDPAALAAALSSYTAALITHRTPHRYEALAAMLGIEEDDRAA